MKNKTAISFLWSGDILNTFAKSLISGDSTVNKYKKCYYLTNYSEKLIHK